MNQRLKQAKDKLEANESRNLARAAALSSGAVRRRPDTVADTGFRLNYSVDADRILHSLAFTRYIDKTQVFSMMDNEHITHRVLHVQLVSKIARTIGAFLGLNLDLLEAIALAHDIGHAPFGHDGERFLSAKCEEHGLGFFQHNLQGVHFLENVEAGGRGLNLSLQVLDGVLAHDGEALIDDIHPAPLKNFAIMDEEIKRKTFDPEFAIRPFTLEGCVARLADSMAYVGRDLEDAILVGLVNRDELPLQVVEVLGSSNGTIVYRLVEDLIANSEGQPWVGFSAPVRQALLELKRFNYSRIYTNPLVRGQHHKVEEIFLRMFDMLLKDVKEGHSASPVFYNFINKMQDEYVENSPPAAMVRDFMASMTDEYFLSLAGDLLWPKRLPKNFKLSTS